MLAVISYGLQVVCGFRETRLCRSNYSEDVSLETQRGMFTALAYGTSGFALNTQRGAQWTEFVTKVAVNRRCDRKR